MKRKGFALIASCALVFSSTALISCNEEEEKKQPAPDVEEDDTIVDMEEPSLTENILDVALEGICSGVVGGAKKVLTKVGGWALDGIAKKIGFSFGKDDSYKKHLEERLSQIDDKLANIQNSVEKIASDLNDQKYVDNYNKFAEAYDTYKKPIQDNWTMYTTIEELIAEQTEEDPFTVTELEENLDILTDKILNGEFPMATAASALSRGFLAEATPSAIQQLNKYNLFTITKYFVEKNTPYEELQHEAAINLLTDAYNMYFQAATLATLAQIRTLSKNGITSFIVNADDQIVVYTIVEDGTEKSYLNCVKSKQATFLKSLEDAGIDTTPYKDLTCKKMIGQNLGVDDQLQVIIHDYNQTTKLFKGFLATYKHTTDDERHLTYHGGAYNGKTQVTKTKTKTLKCTDFIYWDKAKHTFEVDNSKFSECTSKEFEAYVAAIKNSSIVTDTLSNVRKLTFRQYFKEVGYKSISNDTLYLVLGARKAPTVSYDDYYNNSYGYENAWQLMTVKLDMTVEEFSKSKNYYPITYATYGYKVRKDNGCAVSFDYKYDVIESHSNEFGRYFRTDSFHSDNYDDNWYSSGGKERGATKYLTIEGLSLTKKSGKYDPVSNASF